MIIAVVAAFLLLGGATFAALNCAGRRRSPRSERVTVLLLTASGLVLAAAMISAVALRP